MRDPHISLPSSGNMPGAADVPTPAPAPYSPGRVRASCLQLSPGVGCEHPACGSVLVRGLLCAPSTRLLFPPSPHFHPHLCPLRVLWEHGQRESGVVSSGDKQAKKPP